MKLLRSVDHFPRQLVEVGRHEWHRAIGRAFQRDRFERVVAPSEAQPGVLERRTLVRFQQDSRVLGPAGALGQVPATVEVGSIKNSGRKIRSLCLCLCSYPCFSCLSSNISS